VAWFFDKCGGGVEGDIWPLLSENILELDCLSRALPSPALLAFNPFPVGRRYVLARGDREEKEVMTCIEVSSMLGV
jgi:hypothetical protein